ncbi:MAG TPA: PIN domain-containing protein [Longimicrobium sp.]|jgi:PIN domain nuclease of toxin-antitoxin system|nr:PIN domain-containing protein [Longimicrobium sp.]
MVTLAVVDTHALIWYAGQRWQKLGREARRVFEEVDAGNGAIFVPALVMVEFGEAVRRGEVKLVEDTLAFGRRLFSTNRFIPVDLTWEIVQRAEELLVIPERGDRLIAATAMELDYPLITRDPEIAAAAGLELIW